MAIVTLAVSSVLLMPAGSAGAAVAAVATATTATAAAATANTGMLPTQTPPPTGSAPTPCTTGSTPPPTVPTTTVPTTSPIADTEPPSTPGKPVLTTCGGTLLVDWAPSTDNVGVTGYIVQRQVFDLVFSYNVSGTRFGISYSGEYENYAIRAQDAAGNVSATSPWTSIGTPPACPPPSSCSTTPTPTTPVAQCAVGYTTLDQWPGGFLSQVSIRNTGSSPVRGWQLRWAFGNGQRINQIWGGTQTQSDSDVTVTNVDWTADIAPGASVTVGFIGTWTGTNLAPTWFTLNGSYCRYL